MRPQSPDTLAARQTRDLISVLAAWRDAYLAWPNRLADLQTCIDTGQVLSGLDIVGDLTLSLRRWTRETIPTGRARDLDQVLEDVGRIVTEAHRDPDRDRTGSLATHLHQKVQGVAGLLTSPSRRIGACCDTLRALRGPESWVHAALEALDAVASAFKSGSFADCRTAIDRAAALNIPIKRVEAARPLAADVSKKWAVVVAEDDDVWQQEIAEALLTLSREHGHPLIEVWPTGDCTTAQKQMAALLRNQRRRVRRQSLLLIADVGLPANAGECAPPGRAAGLALLQWVRQQSLELPIIVVTTGANALDETLALHALGISDYVLKREDGPVQLRAQLERIITVPHLYLVQLDEDRSVLRVDGVNVELTPHLLRLSRALIDHGPKATAATLASAITAAGERHVDPTTVDKYVAELRAAVAKAYVDVGRSIDPARELLVTVSSSDDNQPFSYELVGRTDLASTSVAAGELPELRVLVIEDDPPLQRHIVDLLNSRHFEAVGVSNVAHALRVAHAFNPNALCLDLHIPLRAGVLSDVSAGLTCLSQLRRTFPKLRTIVLTAHADEDDSRKRLHEDGVEVDDIIPKRGEWRGELACRMVRLEWQWRRDVVLPLRSTRYVLDLKFSFGAESDPELPRSVEAFGKSWPLTDRTRRYLWVLAKADANRVPTDRIASALYPRDSLSDALKKIKTIRARLRMEIADRSKEWFGATADDAKMIARMIVATDRGLGDLLNARIITDRPSLLSRAIHELGLPRSLSDYLIAAGITTIRDLQRYSDSQLEDIGIAKRDIDAIDDAFADHELRRAEDE